MLNFRKLKRDFSHNLLQQGRDLHNNKKVISAKILRLDEDTIRFSAKVMGGFDNTYESEVEIDRFESETIHSNCDCTYRYDCQHIAALLFYLEKNIDSILIEYSKGKDLRGIDKSLLETIKVSLEWSQYFFPSIKDTSSSFNHLLSSVTAGKDSFSISKFTRSALKATDSSFEAIKLKDPKTKLKKFTKLAYKKVHEVRAAFFYLIFDFFKLLKSLKKYSIINFGEKLVFSRLEKIANICASFNSVEGIYIEAKLLFKLRKNQNPKNDVKIVSEKTIDLSPKVPIKIKALRHLLKIAELIGRLSYGIIFFASLYFATTQFFLPIDTIILITTIAHAVFDKIYIEPIKKEKAKLEEN